ncbi:MAG TPA: thiamine phosphate synthase [Candidatus Polarisedimenticolia bacterium]|nr:thiamine phosphate synthase [Candidatus Polarisedimenticolia bacterium]
MLIYVVTDRRLRPDLPPMVMARQAARCGADMLQIREKDLPGGELLALASAAADERGAEVFVNGRPDVALAAGANVHLPSDGLPPAQVGALWGGAMRIGVSVHGAAAARTAEAQGADFVTCGPVFDTPSKRAYGPPLGLAGLEEALRAVSIPVLAIGGVGPGNLRQLARLGVPGVAVVSAVIGAPDMAAALDALRGASS